MCVAMYRAICIHTVHGYVCNSLLDMHELDEVVHGLLYFPK